MFTPATYLDRRTRLISQLAATHSTALIFLPGHLPSPINCTGNTYPFRQDSTFTYFFGLQQPNVAGIIDIAEQSSTIFASEQSMDDIIWSGTHPTLSEYADSISCNRYQDLATLQKTLETYQKKGREILILPPYRASTREWLSLLQLQKISPSPDLRDAVVTLRAVKTNEEIAEIEKALTISRTMYLRAMQIARPEVTETAVAGALHSVLAEFGSMPSFHPICSVRGEVLHNHSTEGTLQKGNLLLIDSGAESPEKYASDITRTLPVGGRFTSRQKEIYSIVLSAQQAAIAQSREAVPNKECHLAAAYEIAEGLKALHILQGATDDIVANGAHALFFPHGIGHHLGLDVHDMENFGEDHVGYDNAYTRSSQFGLSALRLARPLQKGFTITVEPGIYFIPPLMDKWKAEKTCADFINFAVADSYKDFGGIRIEDDILITSESAKILGPPIPKTIDEIEQIMGA